jgi:hypothetical protein
MHVHLHFHEVIGTLDTGEIETLKTLTSLNEICAAKHLIEVFFNLLEQCLRGNLLIGI